ncbi:hypothetical protein D1B33_01480 [Lysinibacillus yapensis]|uniref:Uncharacterized protein n=1 Tax=Ureibacillus yapensis TaxID=2304605 RepID=A0A396SDZ9_9BACL|nr:hypothetical protein [Lysinibacillus yapensis]RHW39544.1 hypothetical protein D1B33_01480 [Lysinibacillus yapensis]
MDMERVLNKDKSQRTSIQAIAVMIYNAKQFYSQEEMLDTTINGLQRPLDSQMAPKFMEVLQAIISDVYLGKIETVSHYGREKQTYRMKQYLFIAYQGLLKL